MYSTQVWRPIPGGGSPALVSRFAYYLSSVPTLIRGIENWQTAAAALAGAGPREPFLLRLRDGSRFYVRGGMDVWVLKETVLDRQYEAGGSGMLDAGTVLDIGAGLGDFAISVALRHPRARVLAYEPFPESFELLNRNLAVNRVENVTARSEAVGTATAMTLRTDSREAVRHSTAATSPSREGLSVSSIPLGAIFQEHGVATCDFLKADCEGAEYDILFNASDELPRIRFIALEYHDGVTAHSHEELERYLAANRFLVSTSPSPVHSGLGLMYAFNQRFPHSL